MSVRLATSHRELNAFTNTSPALSQRDAHELLLPAHTTSTPPNRTLHPNNLQLLPSRRTGQRPQHRPPRRPELPSRLRLPPAQLPIRPQHPHRVNSRGSFPSGLRAPLAPAPSPRQAHARAKEHPQARAGNPASIPWRSKGG